MRSGNTYHYYIFERALRMIKAISTWIWLRIIQTEEWKEAIGKTVPSRFGVIVNYLLYVDNHCSGSRSLMRALYSTKTMRYLLPFGLCVSKDVSKEPSYYENDIIMSLAELSYFLRLDYEQNEVRFNLTPLPSKYVQPPIIAECPVNLECRVVEFHHVGDHDLFIGEVLLEHVDEDKVNINGERDESKLDPLIWLGRGFYRLGEKIGEYKW